MKEEWKLWLEQAKNLRRARRAAIKRQRQTLHKDFDQIVRKEHHTAFEEINCLYCANCCKTTSPDIRESDLTRMAAALHLRPVQVIERFLKRDGSGYIVNQSPCPFLGSDNYCSIYEHRPAACRDFPHTDRKNQWALLDLGLQNSTICPAVAKIFVAIDGLLKSP